MKRLARLVALSLALLGATLLPPTRPAAAASLPLYTLDAWVDFQTGTVRVRETLALTNQTAQTWDSLVFTVLPAQYGAFNLYHATVNARAVEARLEDTSLVLPLSEPLPPGASMVATLDFSLQVPWRGGRFGRGSQVMALGNWFPILAVYRDGRLLREGEPPGWARGRYVEIGDAFFSQVADFRVVLRTTQPLTVAHSGVLVSQAGNTWSFRAKQVRDFALALSPRYATLSQSVDGVEVTVFYLPGHRVAATEYLEAAGRMLSWLGQALVPYPYPALQIAEIEGQGSTTVGQEYPGLVFLADSIAGRTGGVDSYASILTAHEVAHQWFYSLVGNDQLHEPWLDEALVTWLSYHRLRVDYPALFRRVWQRRVVSPPLPDHPVDVSLYDYASENPYLALAYRKGALFLEELYTLMGDRAFFTALKDYTSAFSGRIATGVAFLDLMQAHTEANLNPLISRYFSYGRYQAPQPLRVTLALPEGQEWSGVVTIQLQSPSPIKIVEVFVDDRRYMTALPTSIVLDTERMEEGPHLLTLRIRGELGEAEVVRPFVVRRPPPSSPAAALPGKEGTQAMSGEEQPKRESSLQAKALAGRHLPPPLRRASGLALSLAAVSALLLAWRAGVGENRRRKNPSRSPAMKSQYPLERDRR